MYRKSIYASLVVSAFLSIPAYAVELTNDDEAAHSVQLQIGEGDSTSQTLNVAAGQTLKDICKDGCIMRLENGAEIGLAGDEIVSIRDGDFTIIE